MHPGLWAFWSVFLLVSLGGTLVVYPGVSRRVPSRLNRLLAAFMSASLLGAFLALAAGAAVNALVVLLE